MAAKYIPDLGDIVWLDFDPQKGREMAKRRPALVLSSKAYNRISELCVVCPITSKVKKYPFESAVTVKQAKSMVLVDQLRSLDWTKRNIVFIQKAARSEFFEVREKVAALLFDDMF